MPKSTSAAQVTTPVAPKYISIPQAVDRLCGTVPISTIRYWILERRFAVYKPGRSVLIDVASFDRYVETSKREAVAQASA